MKAIRLPSGDQAGFPTPSDREDPAKSSAISRVTAEPSACITEIPSPSAKTILVPSGDQAGSTPRASERSSEPSAAITWIRPPRSNAMRRPSGDQAGRCPRVSHVAPEPSASATWIPALESSDETMQRMSATAVSPAATSTPRASQERPDALASTV